MTIELNYLSMAETTSLSTLQVGKRIERERLGRVVEEAFMQPESTYTITSSVLDYVIEEPASVLQYEIRDDGIEYQLDFQPPEELPEDAVVSEQSRLKDTFLRASIATPPNLEAVMSRLREEDDVIIGVDTNVLWDCTLTSFLLEEIYAKPFPNWILIAVPRLVMAETENAANAKIRGGGHPRVGWPSYKGRVGHRALQEAMDIRRADPNRPGLAMMSIGDISEDASEFGSDNWRIDALIRDQFKKFLEDINFHKGTYFLSQDRVNVMMSGTEGTQGLYLQKPEMSEFRSGIISPSQLTRLMTELCLQFGEISIERTGGDRSMTLEIFWPGKQVEDWRNGRMNVCAVTP